MPSLDALSSLCGFPPPGAPDPAFARGRRLLAALLVGVALTLGQAPWFVLPAALLGWALAARLWAFSAARGPRAAFGAGWAAGAGFFLSGLTWIGEAFLVDAERYAWMAPFAVGGLAVGLGIFWACGFAGAAMLAGRGRLRGLGAALLFAGAMAGMEWLRAHILTGFPWALPSYALLDVPAVQAAGLLGPHGLGLALIFLCAAPALAPARPGAAAWTALGAGALSAAWIWGAGIEAAAPSAAADAPQIRIVQPNAQQKDKWRPELQGKHLRDLLDLTQPAPGQAAPALTLWPETPGPWILRREPELRARIAEIAGGAVVLTGARRIGLDASGMAEWRNGMEAVGPDGALIGAYDKHHLVPFGEYLPLSGLMGALGLEAFANAGFGAGPGPRRMDLPGLPPLQPQICYETIFPDEVLTGADRPAWIAQSTNDAWFGASAGPHQHFHQARMRAIEQGLPVVRSANTGISAVIDARGRVLESLPLNVAGAIQAPLPPAADPTFYARHGDLPALGALGLCLLAGVGLARRRG